LLKLGFLITLLMYQDLIEGAERFFVNHNLRSVRN
jgi:hypothetical protein